MSPPSQIPGLIASIQGAFSGTSQTLSVTADASLRDNTRIGDIIEARVLRSFDGGRYSVSIGGKEQVVDSAIPLTTGELLYGRVVGLNDNQVVVKKVYDQSQLNNLNSVIDSEAKLSTGEKLVREVFSNYLASISGNDKSVLLQSIANSSSPQLTALTGLVLSKIGLSIQPAYLKALEKLIQTRNANERSEKIPTAAVTNSNANDSQSDPDNTVNLLAGLIAEAAILSKRQNDNNSATPDENESDTYSDVAVNDENVERHADANTDNDEYQLGRWILNAQTHDNISHRLLTLPIIIDGKLVEIDLSFYEQKQSQQLKPAQRFKRLVFSLNLDNLGPVNIEANITDNRLKLVFATENAAATETMAKYLSELKSSINGDIWNIDDIQYVTRESNNEAVWSVVTHHVSQDYISRLM